MLNPRLEKTKSTTDLFLPFRGSLDSPARDMKQFILAHKNQNQQQQFNFEVVDESLIEASKSQNTCSQIDVQNPNILNDQSASCLSRSGIECDLIRIQRLEDDRVRKMMSA